MGILIANKGLSGRFKISGNSTGGFKARYVAPPAFDADAQAFFDRVTAAGGFLTQTEKNAVNAMTLSFKSAGIWTLMKAIYPMVGSSSASCAQNLKSSSFTGTFTSGWTFASAGVTPNGSSAYMNTGLNTSTNLVKTSAHLSVYCTTNVGSGYDLSNSSDNGATIDPTFLIARYSNNLIYFGIGDQSYATNTSTADSRGFIIGATNGSTQKLYKSGSLIQTGTAGAGGLANNNIYLGANNGNGTATLFTSRQYTFASIGDGLSDTNASNLYTAVQAFQTTLGRQV